LACIQVRAPRVVQAARAFRGPRLKVLYVHGMGRSPLSGTLLMRRLARAGHARHSFGYAVTLQDFEAIRRRLVRTIVRLSADGPIALVGHSLGGVLLRAAIAELPQGTPVPSHLFLLGSPVRAVRPAQRFAARHWYRLLTRSSGQLLGSPEGMAALGTPHVRTVAIAGSGGWWPTAERAARVHHDGVVSVEETRADWLDEHVLVPVPHSLLPVSRLVSELVLERLAQVPFDNRQ
jgi:hypothetical protein